jgi:hypothetical protein
MDAPLVRTDNAGKPQSPGSVPAPVLHADPHQRSKLVNDPIRSIPRNTVDGRATYDLAVLMLPKVVGHDINDRLVQWDVREVAEDMVMVGKMRLDPRIDQDKVTRKVRTIELRKRRLGLVPSNRSRGNLIRITRP